MSRSDDSLNVEKETLNELISDLDSDEQELVEELLNDGRIKIRPEKAFGEEENADSEMSKSEKNLEIPVKKEASASAKRINVKRLKIEKDGSDSKTITEESMSQNLSEENETPNRLKIDESLPPSLLSEDDANSENSLKIVESSNEYDKFKKEFEEPKGRV